MTWQDAVAAAGSYEDELVNRFRVDRAALRAIQPPSTALHLTALTIGKADIAVTDFGGSAGEMGADFLAAFPNANYTVVENRTLVRLMSERGRATMQFAATIQPECDIFFSSGALQYLADPVAVLEAGFESARHAVVLARNCFSDMEVFTVQRSRLFDHGGGPIPPGYTDRDTSCPHRTIKESAVNDIASRHGFYCVARLEEHSGTRGGAYGRQLVFLRRTHSARCSAR